jgi:hypothetical protein
MRKTNSEVSDAWSLRESHRKRHLVDSLLWRRKRHREKVGRKSDAIKLYQSRKADVVAGREASRAAQQQGVTLSELIDDVLEFVLGVLPVLLIFPLGRTSLSA